jgi:SNF2 family DNA or RNA helicase
VSGLGLDLSSILLLSPCKSSPARRNDALPAQEGEEEEGGGSLLCMICSNDLEGDAVCSPTCGHAYCMECIREVFKQRYGIEEESQGVGAGAIQGTCPSCDAKLSMKDLKPLSLLATTKRLKEIVKFDTEEDSSYWFELEEDARQAVTNSIQGKGKEKEKEKGNEKEKGKEKEKGNTRKVGSRRRGGNRESLGREDAFLLSTKIRALVDNLKKISHKQPAVKSLVFSQFTMCLDLIELALKMEGLSSVRLDGMYRYIYMFVE